MGVINTMDKFKFVVESEALGGRVGFVTCSGMNVSTAVMEYREGGDVAAEKTPGLVTYEPVTFTRAGRATNVLFDWFQNTYNTVTGLGSVPPELYTTLDVIQQDYAGNEVKRWRLYKAWCSGINMGDFDNTTSEKRMVEITVQYKYFVVV